MTYQQKNNDSNIQAAIEYKVKVANASEHLFEVTMKVTLPNNDRLSVVAAMPAWIPGSYMIRDFSRNLHSLQTNDADINIKQIDKQQWEITCTTKSQITEFTLHYLIYAYDLSVRSAFINDEYAFFNGTSVFLCIREFEYLSHKVIIGDDQDTLLPNITTAMPRAKTNKHTFCSADYYELIDHPVLIGKFEDYYFDIQGHRFHIVFTGQHDFDFPRIEKDLTKIIKHHIRLFGEFPCKEYWFISLICNQGFGGLEHLSSTVLQYSRFDIPSVGDAEIMSKEYQQFLSLCSHELFHTWHVKRIKPSIMHQPNLFEEVYTPQLWIYEGFTSFYDDLSLARTRLISPHQYLQILNETITRLIRNPGRLKQSVSMSSVEAWNKFYKQDAASINHIVSYYNKGAIIAICLDITLRQLSNNKVSLDDVMRQLWLQYGHKNIGTSDDVILRLCQREYDIDLSSFLHLATLTTMDLPLPTLLQSIGLNLTFRASHHFKDKGGESALSANFDIGAVFASLDKSLKVISIQENRAASIAGLQLEDTIIALNKWQCDESRFMQVLNRSTLGETLPLDVMRDGRLITLSFKVLPAVPDTCEISVSNMSAFEKWLGIANQKAQ